MAISRIRHIPSIIEICDGNLFELRFSGFSITKHDYDRHIEEDIQMPGATAYIRRIAYHGPIEVNFSNLSELSAKGILKNDLELDLDLEYKIEDKDYEIASADINNPFDFAEDSKPNEDYI